MNHFTLNFKKLFVLISCVLISCNYYAQTPDPVLCFEFSGNFNATGNGAVLNSIGTSGIFSTGASICNVGSLYEWEISSGLELLNPGNYFSQDHYTIELLFKFTTQPYPKPWQKVIDFKNQTSDMGLYLYNDNLQMYSQYTGTSGGALPNEWVRLFLTRDASTDSIKGYINNNLEIALLDDLSAGVFADALIIFKDDNIVSGEESAGVIDYMRIYDHPLSKSEIDYIIDIPTINITGGNSVCPGDSLLITASGADNYIWSNGMTTESIYVSAEETVSLHGFNSIGCMESCPSNTASVTIQEYEVTPVNLGEDIPICNNEQVVLDAGSYISYNWFNNINNQTNMVSEEGEYWVSVEDINGCLSNDTINLFTDSSCEYNNTEEQDSVDSIFIPNVFTPNGDGLNEKFLVKGDGIRDLSVKIFDRWGNLLYESSEINEGWDGKYRGVKVSSGTYSYVIDGTYINKQGINEMGFVTVLY